MSRSPWADSSISIGEVKRRIFGETSLRLEQPRVALRGRGARRDRGARQRAVGRDRPWARQGAGGDDPSDQDRDAAVAQSGPARAARASGRGGPARAITGQLCTYGDTSLNYRMD